MRLGRILCCLALSSALWAQPLGHYKRDVATQILGAQEVSGHVNKGVELETSAGQSIIQAHIVPFQDVGLAENKQPGTGSAPKGSWEVPPFPQIGPPSAATGEVKTGMDSSAPAFQGVSELAEAPSADLRPLPGTQSKHSTFRDFRIPEPLSRVCFSSQVYGVCQLSLYGGSSSFAAESAFQALGGALENKQTLQGFGKDAWLGVYLEPGVTPSLRADGPGFAEIETVGTARPDLTDPGSNQARKAPAFQDVSTRLESNPWLDLSRMPRRTPSTPARAPRHYWVVVIYFPDRALTAELLLDQRLGTPQDIVDLAALVQTRVKAL